LALEQAAAYLEETGATPAEYLELLGDRAKELFALGRPATTEQTIATTWRASLERLRAEAPAAEELLTVCAFLAPDDLPRTLLTDHAGLLPDRLAAAVADRLEFQQTLGTLRRYSLATLTPETVGVHRLVQAVVRHTLDPEQTRVWAAAAVGLVLAGFPDQAEDFEAWPMTARLLPHALAATDHAEGLGVDPIPTAGLLHQAGRYLWSRAEYTQAKTLHQRALSIREAEFGPDHPNTAYSLHNLANVLYSQGDLDDARSLYERALAIRETCLGADHPDTAYTLQNLANVQVDQGDLDGARALFERALAIRETRLGDHPDTAQTLTNLASVLVDQGDHNGARALFRRALLIREAEFGPYHPQTAHSLNNLANLLAAQGDLDGARTLQEHALAIRETHLGADHPWTATVLNDLGVILRDQGDLDRARALFERALSIHEARLGADHPETVRDRRNLTAVEAALDDRQ
jgi:tetratricopeptide (TPR) repeat protein